LGGLSLKSAHGVTLQQYEHVYARDKAPPRAFADFMAKNDRLTDYIDWFKARALPVAHPQRAVSDEGATVPSTEPYVRKVIADTLDETVDQQYALELLQCLLELQHYDSPEIRNRFGQVLFFRTYRQHVTTVSNINKDSSSSGSV
jgi:hypothetical protein